MLPYLKGHTQMPDESGVLMPLHGMAEDASAWTP